MYSNLINPAEVIRSSSEKYALTKVQEIFPNYVTYTDLDILCEPSEKLVKDCQRYIEDVYRYPTEVKVLDGGRRIHLDVKPRGYPRLDFKFDFITSLDVYSKCKVKSGLMTEALDNRICDEISCYRLSQEHEMVIRMLEYLEYVEERPDKVKHLHYILDKKQYIESMLQLWDKYVVSNTDVHSLIGVQR
jgi:hypothetical protein